MKEELLQLSNDDLLEMFGRDLTDGEPLRGNPNLLRERALAWIAENNTKICKVICTDFRVREKLRAHDSGLMFDWACEILTEVFTGIPVGALAAYLVKVGVDTLCKDHLETSSR